MIDQEVNRLEHVLAREEPTMAVVIASELTDDVITDIVAKGDVVEFRADKFENQDPDYLIRQMGRLATLPLLLTIRIKEEGGNWDSTKKAEKLRLINQLLPFADGVDIELRDFDLAKQVVDMAKARGKVAIVSSHFMESTPESDVLEATYAKAAGLDPSFIKIVASADNEDEYERIETFTEAHKEDNIITVAMGLFGPISRVKLVGKGSHLTYASTPGEAVVTGQIDYDDMWQQLSNEYSNYPVPKAA